MRAFLENNPAMAVSLVALVAGGMYISRRIFLTVQYWNDCKRDTIQTPGVSCSTWTRGDTVVEWFRVNDVIMGGKSSSALSRDRNGRLVFSGEISTIGGGFAAVRTTENFSSSGPVAVPKDASEVRVVVEGDGQMWKVNLGLGHGMMDNKPTWTHDFLTQKGKRTTHTLPLSAFAPTVRLPFNGFLLHRLQTPASPVAESCTDIH
jgi:hypothetical protein